MITFEETVETCLGNPEFMKEYRRLSKSNVGASHGIVALIDKATGYDKKEAFELFEFIRDYIWIPSQLKEGDE